MIDIIVVGYPKSGNTWITRLVGELLQAPIIGFWNSNQYEMAVEGLDRSSNFQIYKGHQEFNKLKLNSSGQTKIIYVIRDPRDICISAFHYWKFGILPLKNDFYDLLRKIYNKFIYPLFFTKNRRLNKMINIIIKGDKQKSWLDIPWNNHVYTYLDKDVLIIKYEDMLSNPFDSCKQILSYLNYHLSDDEIRISIDNQSFERKKNQLSLERTKRETEFLRKGQAGDGKKNLSKKQYSNLTSSFQGLLEKFDYNID